MNLDIRQVTTNSKNAFGHVPAANIKRGELKMAKGKHEVSTKKPPSKNDQENTEQQKKNKRIRIILYAIEILIIAAVTFWFLTLHYVQQTQPIQSTKSAVHAQGIVTEMNDEIITVKIQEKGNSNLENGYLLHVPVSIWNKANAPTLSVGSNVVVYMNESKDGDPDDTREVITLVEGEGGLEIYSTLDTTEIKMGVPVEGIK